MGQHYYSDHAYKAFSQTAKTKPNSELFNKTVKVENIPTNIVCRESRDSENHPESLAIIIGIDVTGSMSSIIRSILTEELNNIMQILIDKGIKDPQILFCAIGDMYHDSKPAFQATQFESGDDKLISALQELVITGQGGGDAKESYGLMWHFAATKTSIDCFEKRNKKGYLFTIGDEGFHEVYKGNELKMLFGEDGELKYNTLLNNVSNMYNVYHINIEEDTACGKMTSVRTQWENALHERFLNVSNYKEVCKTISSVIGTMESLNMSDVIDTLSNTAQLSVTKLKKEIYKPQNGIVAI